MENSIGREEHEEFVRRMEDEHERINHRLAVIEDTVRNIGELTASVHQLAENVKDMVKSQERQENRLEALEGRDGEMWRKVSTHAVTAIISIILTYIFAQIGIG